MKKVRKAVIPAAGLGTRFLPATKAMAKEMLPVVDTPSIQFVVEEALKSGIKEILIITGKGKNAIEDHFDANFDLEANLREKGKTALLEKVESSTVPSIHYVRQPYPKGLGDAILQAESFVGNEPFVVLLGDDIMPDKEPLAKQLIDLYEEYGKGSVATMQIPQENANRFGIIDVGDQIAPNIYEVNHLIEKPEVADAPSNLGIMGRYVLTPEIFAILKKVGPDQGNEIQLTDALELLNQQSPLLAYQYTGRRFDVGDKFGMLIANIEMGLEHPDTKDKMRKLIADLAQNLKKSKV